MLRNIYAYEDESPVWKSVISEFPNKVPKFATKEEAKEFARKNCRVGSNPDYLHLQQSVSTLVDRQQMNKYLLPKILEYDKKWRQKHAKEIDLTHNIFYNQTRIHPADSLSSDSSLDMSKLRDYITSRYTTTIHQEMSSQSRYNSFNYIYEHMKCGIYIMIRNNSLVLFVPFVNKDYINTFANRLQIDSIDGSLQAYAEDRKHCFHSKKLEPFLAMEQWWLNGNIVCNQYEESAIDPASGLPTRTQYWKDQFLFTLKDMFAHVCAHREIPDCEFFLNKRDYPQLKYHPIVPSALAGKQSKVADNTGTGSSNTANIAAGATTTDDQQPRAAAIPSKEDITSLYQTVPRSTTGYSHLDEVHQTLSSSAATGTVTSCTGDLAEPYGFVYGRDDNLPQEDLPLQRPSQRYRSLLPMVSFYTSDRFADLPIPPTEDWEAATGEVFPGSFIHSINPQDGSIEDLGTPRDLFSKNNVQNFPILPWSAKKSIIFFRGTASGGGTTAQTNQRIRAAELAYQWDHGLVEYSGSQIQLQGKLDAKLVGWNARDKKLAKTGMTFIHKSDYAFLTVNKEKNFVPIYEQGKYKYLLYIEGHCAACRYGFMMSLGSVIFKVTSTCVADAMWYFPLLTPYIDHVPVKADFSDLAEVFAWCEEHPEQCQQIAKNARKFFEEVISCQGICDYLQMLCVEMNTRYHRYDGSSEMKKVRARLPKIPRSIPLPKLTKTSSNGNSSHHRGDGCDRDGQLCTYCEQTTKPIQPIQPTSQQQHLAAIGGSGGRSTTTNPLQQPQQQGYSDSANSQKKDYRAMRAKRGLEQLQTVKQAPNATATAITASTALGIVPGGMPPPPSVEAVNAAIQKQQQQQQQQQQEQDQQAAKRMKK